VKSTDIKQRPFKRGWFLFFGPGYLLARYVDGKGGFSTRNSYAILFLVVFMASMIIAIIFGWL